MGAVGTAGAVFIVLAALAWFALPFGHPVYAVFIPPIIAAGGVYAALRMRRPSHPSLRESTPRGHSRPAPDDDEDPAA